MTNTAKHNCSHGHTKVVFRCWPNGDILALFPEVPADIAGNCCSSYAHCGQHGGADYFHCIRITKPALPVMYAALKAELEQLGYCLTVIKRATRRDHNNRQNQLKTIA